MRRGAIGVAAFLTVLVAPLVALEAAARLTPPPSLARLEDRSPAVLDDRGGLLRAFLTKDQRWRLRTTARDVPPELVAMLLAYEDKRFYRHGGVDHLALVRAAAQLALSRRVRSGGSTLTMQVARLLEPSGDLDVTARARFRVRFHFRRWFQIATECDQHYFSHYGRYGSKCWVCARRQLRLGKL